MAGTQTTVVVSGIENDVQVKEKEAAGTVYPGDIIRPKEGTADEVIQLDSGTDPVGRNVAVESMNVDIDGSYDAGDMVKYVSARKGDELYARVYGSDDVTEGQVLTVADSVTGSAGALSNDTTNEVKFAMAQEAAGSTTDTKIKVTVI